MLTEREKFDMFFFSFVRMWNTYVFVHSYADRIRKTEKKTKNEKTNYVQVPANAIQMAKLEKKIRQLK